MPRQRTHTTPLPAHLESPRAKLVYLYLSTEGGATVDELKRDLAMTKLCLLSVLETLREKEVVRRDEGQYVIVRDGQS